MSGQADDRFFSAITGTVRSHLENLSKRHSLDPLKELFSVLDYDPVSEPISRRNWRREVEGALKEDPLIVARGGDSIPIIYARLQADKLARNDERDVIAQLLKRYPDSMFVFSNNSLDQWHFVNVKSQNGSGQGPQFRRFTIGPDERLRTAADRLARIALTHLPQRSRMEIMKRHDQAFDVTAVTGEFFKLYQKLFEEISKEIRGIADPQQKHTFTQQLFNRLMFIAFVQKKRWLRLNGQSDYDYLKALWEDYGSQSKKRAKTTFYADRLWWLFFLGLNTPKFSDPLIGNVPFLNGGLFEKEKEDQQSGVIVPDECINSILHDLFDRFNFTVAESTPFDLEVAVDPEMLGQIFERLVTRRHETGSYYTPKPIVSFMCKEALRGYLHAKLPYESEEAIAQFVDEHEPQQLHDPESMLDALRQVTICDPACGSGAYLLGMLHELLDLRESLFVARRLDPHSVYQRKLEIIQKNLYGVDKDPFAVNIARLRLWLSLVVEFEGIRPEPLPNLNFKIEQGDSLTAPDPHTPQHSTFRHDLISQFREKKAKYMSMHYTHEKQLLRQEIADLRQAIAEWTYGKGKESVGDGFDWAVEFAEIFIDGGFHIVIANPPYVRADAQFKHLYPDEEARQAAISEWKQWRSVLLKRNIYQTLYEKWDLYIPFLERAYQLLSKNGQMVFIISDAYNAAKYSQKSQKFFLQHMCIERIDFCSDIPLFESGVRNTIIHFTKSVPVIEHEPIRAKHWGRTAEDFVTNVECLPTAPQINIHTDMFRPESMLEGNNSYANCIKLGRICYVSKGMVVHADERTCKGTFKLEDLVSSIQDTIHSKPFVLGRDLSRWVVTNIRYLEWRTQRAPGLFSRPTFPELHNAKEKLLSKRISGDQVVAVYDDKQLYSNQTINIFVPWHSLRGVRNKSIQKTARYSDERSQNESPSGMLREDLEELSQRFDLKYLLGIMNSAFALKFFTSIRKGDTDILPDEWKQLPIAYASKDEQTAIVALVQKCLDAGGVGCEEWEEEIDLYVAALYGL
ncbi:MAG: DNA methyltransferase [Ktedonobacteraceae bacterium]